MTTLIGSIEPFQKNEDLNSYLERFNFFVLANDIPVGRKKAVFLSVIGASTFNLIKDLAQPNNLNSDDVTFDNIVTLLKNHIQPKASLVVYRYKFDKCVKGTNESIGDYINRLKHLSEHCNFGENLNQRLRDKFVSGLNDDRIIHKLLTEGDELTFARACQVSLHFEQNKTEAKELLASSEVHKIKYHYQGQTKGHKNNTEQPRKPCYRCLKSNHTPENCFFKSKSCNTCGITGHISPACRKKNSDAGKANKKKYSHKKKIHQIEETESPNEYSVLNIHQTNAKHPPIKLKLILNKKEVEMEVDTGASCSMITNNTWENIKSDDVVVNKDCTLQLTDYSGNKIAQKGQVLLPVTYGKQENMLNAVIVEDGACNLLGRDWLKMIKLDWHNIFKTTVNNTSNWAELYPKVFKEELGKYNGPKVSIIKKSGVKPIFLRERNLPFSIRDNVKKELDRMTDSGVLIPVLNSDWATPIVPVVKSDGHSIRVCGDYRLTVNKCSEINCYPLPRLETMIQTLSPGKMFSKLDLSQAYLQLEMDEESQKMCVLNTPFGLFKVTRLPYGVSSSPAIFQRVIENLLKDIPQCVVYIDDLLVTGKDKEEHDLILKQVLQRLEDSGLTLKLPKCEFNKQKVIFLGHVIDQNGISPIPAKVEAIQKIKPPTNVSELKTYLGIINYYHKFIPNVATILEPLHILLRNGQEWKWTTEQQNAFERTKIELISPRVLTHFDPSKPIILTTDASPHGIAAVLSHQTENGEKPVGFVSRSLNQAERNYSQTEREGLAVIFGIIKFHQYLYGHHFKIVTDHRPLIGLFLKGAASSKIAAGRLMRWSVHLNQFNYDLVYQPGPTIAHADTISRFPVGEAYTKCPIPAETVLLMNALENTPLLHFTEIGKETKKDKILQKVSNFILSNWPEKVEDSLKPYWNKRYELSMQSNCILWGSRVIIPEVLRNKALNILHEDHTGIVKMKRLAREFIFWPKIDDAIVDMAKKCYKCQMHSNSEEKISCHPWHLPTKPFERIHADFAENFMGTNFLIIIDAYSKWVDVYQQTRLTSSETIKNLSKCFANYGIPLQLHTDNGSAFTSQEFDEFAAYLGIKHTTNPAFSPRTNGIAERMVQTFKGNMKKIDGSLEMKLNRFLLKVRTTEQESTGKTPAFLLQGRELRTRINNVRPTARVKEREQLKVKETSEEREFDVGSLVLVKTFKMNKLFKWCIGTVTDRLGRFKYQIELNNGIVITRHTDAIKPFYGKAEEMEETEHEDLQLKNTLPRLLPIETLTENEPIAPPHSEFSDDLEAVKPNTSVYKSPPKVQSEIGLASNRSRREVVKPKRFIFE